MPDVLRCKEKKQKKHWEKLFSNINRSLIHFTHNIKDHINPFCAKGLKCTVIGCQHFPMAPGDTRNEFESFSTERVNLKLELFSNVLSLKVLAL